MAEASSNVLDLDRIDDERPVVKVDGTPYPMRFRDEISYDEHVEASRTERKLRALARESADRIRTAREEDRLLTSEEEQAEEAIYRSVVDAKCKLAKLAVPGIPDEVMQRLEPGKLDRIMDFFTQLGAGSPSTSSGNGLKSDVGSSVSTEAA